jgi:CheY-like chemotaxis protein
MKKGKVLHLEDEDDWIEHVRNLLEQEYDVFSTYTSEEALKLIKPPKLRAQNWKEKIKKHHTLSRYYGLVFDKHTHNLHLINSSEAKNNITPISSQKIIFDVGIFDISIINSSFSFENNELGLEFIKQLKKQFCPTTSGNIFPIIILSGGAQRYRNIDKEALGIVAIFDKGSFVANQEKLKQIVADVIQAKKVN